MGNALSSGTLPGCQAPQQATLLALRGIEEQPWPQWTDGETEAQTHHTYRRVKWVRNTEGLSWGACEGHDLLYAQVLSQKLGPTEVFWWLGPILKDPDGSGTEANRREAHGLFPTSSPANAAHPPGRGRGLHTPTLGPGVLLASSCPPHPTTTFSFHGPGQGSEGHQIPARQAARLCLANGLQGPFKRIVTLSSHS